ncbi:hypothetical protein TRFO_38622 [Tritrichomonas foetus]|uniref:Uncharacterized protein n=1 Tax=Tritrichomonas foetus TaxID=1144522 RepID=A0A1J4JCA9_9EUKA|nr:hypothetical protein TRFO_38622 [Tritrichomonas foetus]|eukprot:OHS95283.1 hypothetical protein TRFO_38622 [Tritrichomonas foetus]
MITCENLEITFYCWKVLTLLFLYLYATNYLNYLIKIVNSSSTASSFSFSYSFVGSNYFTFTRSVPLIRNLGFDISEHLFVSVFFPLNETIIRHPIHEYQMRVSYLFKFFKHPLLIFTTEKGKEILLENHTNIPENFIFSLKFQSPLDFPRIKNNFEKYTYIANLPHYKSSENYAFSGMIGAIWNSKICLLEYVLRNDEFKDTKFIHWLDIGMIKSDEYSNITINQNAQNHENNENENHQKENHENKNKVNKNDENLNSTFTFPNVKRLNKIFSLFPNKMLYSLNVINPNMNFYGNDKLDNVDTIQRYSFIIASYFGGPRDSVRDFVKDYYEIHDILIQNNLFVIREEYVMGVMAYFHPEKCMFLNTKHSNCEKWHSAVGFLANRNICGFENAIFTLEKTQRVIYTKINMLSEWE